MTWIFRVMFKISARRPALAVRRVHPVVLFVLDLAYTIAHVGRVCMCAREYRYIRSSRELCLLFVPVPVTVLIDAMI